MLSDMGLGLSGKKLAERERYVGQAVYGNADHLAGGLRIALIRIKAHKVNDFEAFRGRVFVASSGHKDWE